MYKVKGKITKVSEVKTLDNGAKVVDYVVEHTSENGYVTPHKFNMYKKGEYSEHVENFVKYNKVGDEVEVEFTIRGQIYNDKIYNSLNHWKIEKLNNSSEQPSQPQPIEEEDDSLPF